MVSTLERSRTHAPSHRHAAPCSPWPWVDLDDEIQPASPKTPPKCPHPTGQCVGCWAGYPQSLFPNWTAAQVLQSKMLSHPTNSDLCVIYRVEVTDDGKCYDPGSLRAPGEDEFWKLLQDSRRADNVRLRALFVEHISVPVLQMLGLKYEIEPFFWTSSVNWIPSRYQEDFQVQKGDHITITLSFPRVVTQAATDLIKETTISDSTSSGSAQFRLLPSEVIDTQMPLLLHSATSSDNDSIILDHLAMHMIRSTDSSTIISYQPNSHQQGTTAKNVHDRVFLAGQSVYWNKLLRASNDPTFILLTMFWYAFYAWDQAFEMLWEHICRLESDVISLRKIEFAQELHKIRAHLLHYATLLEDFSKSVEFVRDTPNPAMDLDPTRDSSREALERECKNLLIQIDRLSHSRTFWDQRLQNIMNLAFSSINIEDSRQMKTLSEAAVRDSAAMKQVAYLTMVFLPATFVSGVFGMNVVEINPGTLGTLPLYAATFIPLSLATVWIVVAMQARWNEIDEHGNVLPMSWWARLSWPVILVQRWMQRRRQNKQDTTDSQLPHWQRELTKDG